jgi:hypothetical protein
VQIKQAKRNIQKSGRAAGTGGNCQGNDMDAYEPHFVADTDGVHFLVRVDDQFVQSYVGRAVLSEVYGLCAPGSDRVAAYLRHSGVIDAAVARRVHKEGRETVLVQASELGAAVIAKGGA